MPIHDSDSFFGGGKVAEIVLWKDKKLSAAILIAFTAIWLLFEVAEFHFVPLLCYFLISAMVVLILWSRAAESGLIKRVPPGIHDMKFQEATLRLLLRKLNWFLLYFYDMSTGKDTKFFLVTIISLWLVSVVGSNFSSLSFLYFVFICLETIPVLYQRYQREVDYFMGTSNQEVMNSFHKVYATLSNRIPKGQTKEKQRE